MVAVVVCYYDISTTVQHPFRDNLGEPVPGR